jgi:hypothetical protein
VVHVMQHCFDDLRVIAVKLDPVVARLLVLDISLMMLCVVSCSGVP